MSATSTTPLTLHVVGTAAEARRLGERMDNCLASYGDQLTGADRVVEVRRVGRTLYAVHVSRGRIVTFEAAGNRPPDRRDVPVVRRLLEEGGYLTATATYLPSGPSVDAVSGAAGSGDVVAGDAVAGGAGPGGAAAEGAGTGPGPGQPTLPLGPRSERRTVPPRRPVRPGRPGPPPGISVQELATELLGPASLQSPDWTEVAAALWGVGLLPRLPTPWQSSFERVVRDLAAKVAVGEDAALPRRPAPSSQDRTRAVEGLQARATPDEPEAWRLRRMAAVLESPLRP